MGPRLRGDDVAIVAAAWTQLADGSLKIGGRRGLAVHGAHRLFADCARLPDLRRHILGEHLHLVDQPSAVSAAQVCRPSRCGRRRPRGQAMALSTIIGRPADQPSPYATGRGLSLGLTAAHVDRDCSRLASVLGHSSTSPKLHEFALEAGTRSDEQLAQRLPAFVDHVAALQRPVRLEARRHCIAGRQPMPTPISSRALAEVIERGDLLGGDVRCRAASAAPECSGPPSASWC